ncbi:glycoside hydrolase [Trametes maxima]|nr:glycoside hydrolase [Trametes maxima]
MRGRERISLAAVLGEVSTGSNGGGIREVTACVNVPEHAIFYSVQGGGNGRVAMIYLSLRTLALALAASPLATTVLGARVQTSSITLPPDAAQRRQDVKDIFLTSWNAYKKFAFPHDDLTPLSQGFTDVRNGWGASAVDALSTLFIIEENTPSGECPNLTNTDDNLFADTWHTAVDSSIHTLLRTSTVGNHTYLADLDDNGRIRHIGSHLACFMAGNWIMGGKLLNNDTIVNIGLALNEGCWNTYTSTATGIGPETFAYISSDGDFTGGGAPSASELAFYKAHGFYITNGNYLMRPEVLESNFYAWRATGDTKFFDRAADATASLAEFLKTPTGAFAPLDNVDSTSSGFMDDQESFWFAEVLKYLCVVPASSVQRIAIFADDEDSLSNRFLTFDDPAHINLDEWVFNTEAHPFIAPAEKDVYGSGKIRPASDFQTVEPN